jgi:hypothetical protein
MGPGNYKPISEQDMYYPPRDMERTEPERRVIQMPANRAERRAFAKKCRRKAA